MSYRVLETHRDRLRRMIAARMDRRLAPQLDPSDVVQETLADAARRLPDYLRDRPMPFYPSLVRLAIPLAPGPPRGRDTGRSHTQFRPHDPLS